MQPWMVSLLHMQMQRTIFSLSGKPANDLPTKILCLAFSSFSYLLQPVVHPLTQGHPWPYSCSAQPGTATRRRRTGGSRWGQSESSPLRLGCQRSRAYLPSSGLMGIPSLDQRHSPLFSLIIQGRVTSPPGFTSWYPGCSIQDWTDRTGAGQWATANINVNTLTLMAMFEKVGSRAKNFRKGVTWCMFGSCLCSPKHFIIEPFTFTTWSWV